VISQVFGEESMSRARAFERHVQTHQDLKGETGEKQSRELAHNFFDTKGIVHKEFVLTGQTVNSAYYCDVLR
jgi:hypothetical protein